MHSLREIPCFPLHKHPDNIKTTIPAHTNATPTTKCNGDDDNNNNGEDAYTSLASSRVAASLAPGLAGLRNGDPGVEARATLLRLARLTPRAEDPIDAGDPFIGGGGK